MQIPCRNKEESLQTIPEVSRPCADTAHEPREAAMRMAQGTVGGGDQASIQVASLLA
jgi:hypothetical protein